MKTIKTFDINIDAVSLSASSAHGGSFDVNCLVIDNEEGIDLGLHENSQSLWYEDVNITYQELQEGLPHTSKFQRISGRDMLPAAILHGATNVIREHLSQYLSVTAKELNIAVMYSPEDEDHPGLSGASLVDVTEGKAALEKVLEAIGDTKIIYRVSTFCNWLGREIKYLEETIGIIDTPYSFLHGIGISLTVTPFALHLRTKPEGYSKEDDESLPYSERVKSSKQ